MTESAKIRWKVKLFRLRSNNYNEYPSLFSRLHLDYSENLVTLECSCPAGFYGQFCQITPCTYNQCKNDSACEIMGENFKCNCKPGYYGTYCEKNWCMNNPCQHDGVCHIGSSGIFLNNFKST